MQRTENAPSVVVVGGGIAGLSAALRLAERGYRVAVYESSERCGGNLSSTMVSGREFDVYPHMFSPGYANFWGLVEHDLGLARRRHFAARTSVKFLYLDTHGYKALTNASSPKLAMQNLFSGVEPPPDMYLFGYGWIDLASREFSNTLLDRFSVNGFLSTRPYATLASAELNDRYIMQVWSAYSDQTSASAYRDYLRYNVLKRQETPMLWLLQGPLQSTLIAPLVERLRSFGATVENNQRALGISAADDGEVSVRLSGPSGERLVTSDYAVLAVPPDALTVLAATAAAEGRPTLVSAVPELTETARLRAEPIPVTYLRFKRNLADLPVENVGLEGTREDLTFLDLTPLWRAAGDQEDGTLLALASSNFRAYPAGQPDGDTAFEMVLRLHEYLPQFETGAYWGDPQSDIDWQRSFYTSNDDHKLFIDSVGSEAWRPEGHYAALPRVLLAGDFVQTADDMSTVEGAIRSGVRAAAAVWQAEPLGSAVPLLEPEVPTQQELLMAKLAGMPAAYCAKWLAEAGSLREDPSAGHALKFAAGMASVAFGMAADWMETSAALVDSGAARRRAGRASRMHNYP
ncbi:MAG: FAD-dependent oxidoreductase [Pseudomonadota bacterium]